MKVIVGMVAADLICSGRGLVAVADVMIVCSCHWCRLRAIMVMTMTQWWCCCWCWWWWCCQHYLHEKAVMVVMTLPSPLYAGHDMWSTSEDQASAPFETTHSNNQHPALSPPPPQVCNACPYPLCACNNEGVMCSRWPPGHPPVEPQTRNNLLARHRPPFRATCCRAMLWRG